MCKFIKEIKLLRNISILLTISTAILSADSVTTALEQRKDVTVTLIDKYNIMLADKTAIPMNTVKSINFSNFMVISKPYGVILRDGSRLSGVLRKKETNHILFRSTSLKEIMIPKSSIAGFFYQGLDTIPLKALPRNIPCVITKTKKIIPARKILWADQNSAAILGKNGMKKFTADELAYVISSNFSPKKNIILRNGDVLNMPIDWNGKKFSMQLIGKPLTLPITTIKKVNLK